MPAKELLSVDHREVDEILDQLFAALARGDRSYAFERLDYFWARLAMHIRAEHLHLFPALLKAAGRDGERDDATIESTIEQLRGDHNFFMHELAAVVKTMRGLEDDLSEIGERIERVRRRLATHNDIEESQIYRLAESLLSPLEASGICRSMRVELDNLPTRFVDDADQR